MNDTVPAKGAASVLRQPAIASTARQLRPLPAATVLPKATPWPAGQKPGEGNEQPAPSLIEEVLKDQYREYFQRLEEEARARGLKSAAEEAVSALKQARDKVVSDWKREEASIRASLKADADRLAALLASLGAEQETLSQRMEPVLARLLFESLVRMLGHHAVEGALIHDVAHQAIKEYRIAAPWKVWLSQSDFNYLHAQGLYGEFLQACHVDESAGPGSCRIETDEGSLDAGLDQQLLALHRLLTQEGRNAGGS
ncbi:flagellar biosynthesis/type III secretory pathway protein FliH [Fluviicoccus keumensis]|uniref:Flagellar assembly protein FliH n=1 Tax=Fluviicoccus keumensis TaxID=1435465 RepID=A0A4Q7YMB3_9GAMM|nr:FliH/SctL family protein [Fluviicoccus keumensis]RZU38500.1 flagellar biosynthesis/type III secretory pathway protein FliH [Fluviicoccus keumensis]